MTCECAVGRPFNSRVSTTIIYLLLAVNRELVAAEIFE
jgi:hypothetical protein